MGTRPLLLPPGIQLQRSSSLSSSSFSHPSSYKIDDLVFYRDSDDDKQEDKDIPTFKPCWRLVVVVSLPFCVLWDADFESPP